MIDGDTGEQPPEVPPPQPVGEPVRLEAHASDQAQINQAARDLYVHHAEGVRRAELGTATQECPYPGLASFGPEQARWFFGREQLTAELLTRLDARLRTGGVQTVVAPSGAGKSSLLHAGLLPKLENGALPGSRRWPTVVFTPTAEPLAALATQIGAFTGADPVALAEQLAADSRHLLSGICGVDSSSRLVMVVDQFEELFTLCTDDRQRHTFIELLTRIATSRSDTGSDPQPVGLVVIGVRADFCAACVDYPQLRTALQDSPLVVGPMSDAELRAAILYPAQDVGLDVEPGLVELLLRDLGDTTAAAGQDGRAGYEAGRLPLLAHALRATWQQHDHLLTVAGYRATGGIYQAVATTADRVFAGLDPAGQDLARILFLRLIKIGDGIEDTRRRMARPYLLQGLNPDSALPVLDAFTQGRLLTQDRDTVEITHEALLRAWPRLCQWIDTDRTGNLTRQELEDTAAAWERDGRDNAGLYRGSPLEVARAWADSRSHGDDLSPAASEFLTASAQQEHRRTNVRRSVLAVLTVLALIASGAAVVAFQQNASAQEKRDTAIVNRIVFEANRLRSTDASLAAQLDLTAYRKRPQTPELYTKLLTTENTVLSTPLLPGHVDTVRSVKFSPDGRTLATVGDDDTIRLWDVADPTRPVKLGEPLTGHDGDVESVAFSPDGRTLATASDDETVRLWNVADPAHLASLGVPLIGHTGIVWSVAFSPDGRVLATAGDDETVRLWNVADPAHPASLGQPLTGHTGAVTSVVFSPDGHTLASGSNDRTVRLWNMTDLSRPASWGEPLTGHPDIILSVAFSPDGHTLASAGAGGIGDYRIRLWDVTDLARPTSRGEPLTGHINNVVSVVFSPDGQTLASASTDQTVRLWNLANPTRAITVNLPLTTMDLSPPITGHTRPVSSVAFSPDGHTVASASADRAVRLWDIPFTILTGHSYSVFSVAFSPDRKTLATASADTTVRLWNVTDPAHPKPLGQPFTKHTDSLSSVVFSPDGHTLATASLDKTVRLWDVTDPTHPESLGQPLAEHQGRVFAVAFSPDGRTLATSGGDNTVRLWDVTDPAHPAPRGQPLTEHTGDVFSVGFSPDGRTLASAGDDKTVRLWNVTDPAHPVPLGAPLVGHVRTIRSVSFSPDSRTLASASDDQSVRLWDVTDPAHPTRVDTPLTGHKNSVNSVAFSPDGRTLASASVDHTVQLWDVTDPTHPTLRGEPLTGHTIAVISVAFSPDGYTLATASSDFTVRLWGLSLDHAIQRICDTTKNTLTEEKWRQHVSEELPFNPPCPR